MVQFGGKGQGFQREFLTLNHENAISWIQIVRLASKFVHRMNSSKLTIITEVHYFLYAKKALQGRTIPGYYRSDMIFCYLKMHMDLTLKIVRI